MPALIWQWVESGFFRVNLHHGRIEEATVKAILAFGSIIKLQVDSTRENFFRRRSLFRVHPTRSAPCSFITAVLPTKHLFDPVGP